MTTCERCGRETVTDLDTWFSVAGRDKCFRRAPGGEVACLEHALERTTADLERTRAELAENVEGRERTMAELRACRGRLLDLQQDARRTAVVWLRTRAERWELEGVNPVCVATLHSVATAYEEEREP